MKATVKLTAMLLGALLIIPGWVYAANSLIEGETQLDRNWGKSFETAKYHQILNPDAEKNLLPVTGIEGQVGEKIMEGHVKAKPKKTASRKEIGVLTIK